MSNKNNMTLRLEKITKNSIAENQVSERGIVKKRSLQEKGITLIALVVTIIILLILAGVTLNMALSQNGLFSKTQEAADKYKQAQSDEEEMIRKIATQMNSEYVGAFVTGYTPDVGSYIVESDKSGYTASQTFTTKEGIKWRIWDFDGNILRIISEDRISGQDLCFSGVNAYNNMVYEINEICRQCYGKKDISGINASSFKRSDIEKVMKNNKYIEYSEEISEGETIKYGDIKNYNKETSYPILWEKDSKWNYDSKDNKGDKEGLIFEEENIDADRDGLGKNNGENFKSSYYKLNFDSTYDSNLEKKDDWINEKYYDLIFKMGNGEPMNTTVALASRSVRLNKENVGFGICLIDTMMNEDGYNIYADENYKSNGETHTTGCAVRPMVRINLEESGYKLERVQETDGTISYKLEEKEKE